MSKKRHMGLALTAALALGLGLASGVSDTEAQANVCNGSALKVTEVRSKARNTCGSAEAIITRRNAAGQLKSEVGPARYRDWSFAYNSWGTAFHSATGNFY
jgi:hypothetical protein